MQKYLAAVLPHQGAAMANDRGSIRRLLELAAPNRRVDNRERPCIGVTLGTWALMGYKNLHRGMPAAIPKHQLIIHMGLE